MEPTEYPAMSGSNTICVATVLLETGHGRDAGAGHDASAWRRPAARSTSPRAAAPARSSGSSLRTCPSFADRLDAPLEVEGWARSPSTSRTAACGTRSPMRARSASSWSPSEARDLSRVGELIRARGARAAAVRPSGEPRDRGREHRPDRGAVAGVGQVTRNAVVVAPGRLDRSATGTGLSARIAALHARGLMRVGDSMTHASVIGSTFDGRIVREIDVGGRAGGRARDPGQRLDHRRDPRPRRSDRPVPGGLPPVRHLARRRRAVADLLARPHAPDPDAAVRPALGEQAPVGREVERVDAFRQPIEHDRRLVLVRPPHADVALPAEGDEAAVG